MIQVSLPAIIKSFNDLKENFPEYSGLITTNEVTLSPKPLREIKNYPKPKFIKCILERIKGSTDVNIILPFSSVKEYFEEKKSLIILLLMEFNIVQSKDEALSLFQLFVNSKSTDDPKSFDK